MLFVDLLTRPGHQGEALREPRLRHQARSIPARHALCSVSAAASTIPGSMGSLHKSDIIVRLARSIQEHL